MEELQNFRGLIARKSYALFLNFSELGRIVRVTYAECLGPLDQEVTTMDLLKRIELRMEFLTQNLERLPLEKVKIAQRVSDNGFALLINYSMLGSMSPPSTKTLVKVS